LSYNKKGMSMTAAVSGFHHVKLPVTDVERGAEWYERVLGFELELRFVEDGVLRGVGLRHPGGVGIALRHDPERAAAASGFDPVALAVPTREDVVRWVRRLEELGETHGGVVGGHTGGAVLVGLRDPDGMEIRLYCDQLLRSLAVPGGSVAYTDTGDARSPAGDGLVLLVHAGVFADWFTPLVVEPALTDLRLVRMVRAGYTEGAAPDRPLGIADHAQHCAALLDELGGRPATVVGHSSSSAIALQLALDRPDLVRGLVLSEPPLVDQLIDPVDREPLQAGFRPVLGAAAAAAGCGDHAAAYDAFMGLVCGPEHREAVATAIGTAGLERAVRESEYFFRDEMAGVADWAFDAADAARVRPPVLLVCGGVSPPPTHRLVARLAEQLPDARVATIDGDNHLLPLRSPAALAELVARHVDAGERSMLR
jgi:pimeloyl-ACP methyl ester carboxylesterase/catechol 2,3-dioxygenase-like lactoylglutathione lyase family enzyme